jgi:hypothetical protein
MLGKASNKNWWADFSKAKINSSIFIAKSKVYK